MNKFWILGTLGVIVSLCYKLNKPKPKNNLNYINDQLEREYEGMKYGC